MKLRFFKTQKGSFINLTTICLTTRDEFNTLTIKLTNGESVHLAGDDADHMEGVLEDYLAFESP
jgi:hypothetical protein